MEVCHVNPPFNRTNCFPYSPELRAQLIRPQISLVDYLFLPIRLISKKCVSTRFEVVLLFIYFWRITVQ